MGAALGLVRILDAAAAHVVGTAAQHFSRSSYHPKLHLGISNVVEAYSGSAAALAAAVELDRGLEALHTSPQAGLHFFQAS